MFSAQATTLRQMARRAIDLILPPRCAGTGEIVEAPGLLTPAFWQELAFVEAPFCQTCGLPFAHDHGGMALEGMLCASCLADEPQFDRARSAVIYNDASRKLILGFKYGDKLHVIKTFMPWMMRAGRELLDECDAIIAVPLHRKRLWQRRFNQSALLAASLSKESGKAYLPHALLRIKSTVPQKGLSRSKRYKNVAGAFAVDPAQKSILKDKTILLIDDVFTSGATLNACARVLRQSGAKKVFVLTLARVTREDFH